MDTRFMSQKTSNVAALNQGQRLETFTLSQLRSCQKSIEERKRQITAELNEASGSRSKRTRRESEIGLSQDDDDDDAQTATQPSSHFFKSSVEKSATNDIQTAWQPSGPIIKPRAGRSGTNDAQTAWQSSGRISGSFVDKSATNATQTAWQRSVYFFGSPVKKSATNDTQTVWQHSEYFSKPFVKKPATNDTQIAWQPSDHFSNPSVKKPATNLKERLNLWGVKHMRIIPNAASLSVSMKVSTSGWSAKSNPDDPRYYLLRLNDQSSFTAQVYCGFVDIHSLIKCLRPRVDRDDWKKMEGLAKECGMALQYSKSIENVFTQGVECSPSIVPATQLNDNILIPSTLASSLINENWGSHAQDEKISRLFEALVQYADLHRTVGNSECAKSIASVPWMSDIGYWTLDIGHWTLDIGHRTSDITHWTVSDS